ncbi:hypothetical protein [Actinomadura rupiterrae]|uniref:hypothetical protein n=1 Tax=Actinomadura rupiterrae TaxID=559627 RepID=UPI0020A3E1B0|nr:hypothetical protein [Actinomadura rupiterrae]MCP2335481.1 hypothetical protein [Actinomadura rupiterrae]
MTLSASPRQVRGGDLLGYTMTVWNAGPGKGARAADLALPDAVDVVGVLERGCAEAGRVVRCTFAATAPGRSRSVHIMGIVRPDAAGVLRATARLAGPSDPVARDDAAEADTRVAPSTDLAVRLTAPRSARTGGVVLIRATVADRGPRTARRVAVNLGAHGVVLTRVRGAKCKDLRHDKTGGYVRCLLGRIASGHARTIDAYVRILPGHRSRSLAASTELDLGDYRPGNNVAVTQIRATPARTGRRL